jgi:tetratricopeptide (TPR) repeat protein
MNDSTAQGGSSPFIQHSAFILHHFSFPMPLDLPKLRKLVSLDQNDPLSRFALGKKLFETAEDDAMLAEAAEHLQFANAAAPDHLATYHVLAQSLIRLGRRDEARAILESGIQKSADFAHGMGRDLGPAMQQMLGAL